jgi:hypothetical protein
MNDTLAVIACDALGCGCGNPQCPVVVAAVLTANGSLPRAAGLRQEQEDRAPAND